MGDFGFRMTFALPMLASLKSRSRHLSEESNL